MKQQLLIIVLITLGLTACDKQERTMEHIQGKWFLARAEVNDSVVCSPCNTLMVFQHCAPAPAVHGCGVTIYHDNVMTTDTFSISPDGDWLSIGTVRYHIYNISRTNLTYGSPPNDTSLGNWRYRLHRAQ